MSPSINLVLGWFVLNVSKIVGSNSLAIGTSNPAFSNPRSKPPQPLNKLMTFIFTCQGKKAPAFLKKRRGSHACDISDWKRCRKKHNESPTLFVRGHYRFCFCVVLVFQSYVTRSEMNLVLLFVSYALMPYTFLFVLTNTQSQKDLISINNYKQKNVGACICLFVVRGLPQPLRRTIRETLTFGVYNTSVKCAERLLEPHAHSESIYYTPWNYLCIVFVLSSIVVVSNNQKQSDVTPFNM